ncbi:MAG: hypothetical protein RLZZ241_1936 [Bacteroidota bacterium]|jgi:uncharacterized protein (DUF1684 family)
MRFVERINGLYWILVLIFFIWNCDDGKRYRKPDAALGKEVQVGVGQILAFQKELNATFSSPDDSPLPDRYRIHFEGLDFYLPDTTYQVWAKLKRTPEALPFNLATTTDRMALERTYGVLEFELKGVPLTLEVYQSPDLMLEEGYEDYLFLPFSDLTNGTETYTGGRYIDLKIPDSDSILIDFNKAYNPYCAYNPKYSCPVVPAPNQLGIAIRAGVKAFGLK